MDQAPTSKLSRLRLLRAMFVLAGAALMLVLAPSAAHALEIAGDALAPVTETVEKTAEPVTETVEKTGSR